MKPVFNRANAKHVLLPALGLVLGLIALLMYHANATGAYYNDLHIGIIQYSVLALVFLAAHIGITLFLPTSWIGDALLALAVVFLAVSVMSSIATRMQSIGWILLSDLESGNESARNALTQFFTAWALYIAALALSVASGFFAASKSK